MKKLTFTLVSGIILLAACKTDPEKDLVLWYNQPATDWNEALPVGNGRIGAIIFGMPQKELIQINENTFWSGGPAELNPNPQAPLHLIEVRAALEKEDYVLAEKLTKELQGNYTEAYQPMLDLILEQELKGEVENYIRDLNISKALAHTDFSVGNTKFKREIFTSLSDNLLLIRLTSNTKNGLNFKLSPVSQHPSKLSINSAHEITLTGKAPSHTDPGYVNYNETPVSYTDSLKCNGMRFAVAMQAVSKDGNVNSDSSGFKITDASEALILISIATSFNGFDKCPDNKEIDEIKEAQNILKKVENKSYHDLIADHIEKYQSYFNRVNFTLDNPEVKDSLPIDQRMVLYKKGESDQSLESLYFQFGRYLLISSSQPGGVPANLQGIWNKDIRPPWSSNYTVNINLEMNYWPAEVCNLSEMHEPLLRFINNLSITGKETAKNFYNAKGWCVHHNSDIWASTNPVGDLGKGSPSWANWPMGGPWLCRHLWEHYKYTSDTAFLRESAYPLMKGGTDFCLDWLIEKDGYLVTAPSTSPENYFILPDGQEASVSIASTMDMMLIWDLFTNTIKAAEILNIDHAFKNLLHEKRDKLYPLKIAKNGRLQEWWKDWEDKDPEHRHISHLYGLHPGNQISPYINTVYSDACRKTLQLRGDAGTGWSKAWKINFHARLLDGNHAYKMLQEQLKESTLNNLFDTHPPFQIDGNFGATAGIAEMLMQSHLGEIIVLPALPDGWPKGEIMGLCARGGFEVSIKWEEGKLIHLEILSKTGNDCTLSYLGSSIKFSTEKNKRYEYDGELQRI